VRPLAHLRFSSKALFITKPQTRAGKDQSEWIDYEPYGAWSKEYNTLWETHSLQKCVCMALGWTSNWGLTELLSQHYDLPPCPWSADHHPLNDARGIAVEFSDLLLVSQQGPHSVTV
jgi:hypothetical protein